MTEHARIQWVYRCKEPWTWLLLPGGPGMGSQSLADLAPCLQGLGSVALVDLPDDGSYRLGKPITLERWQQALWLACKEHSNVILVGHSFGGMLIQSTPELESQINALVLMNTAPDNGWYTSFSERAAQQGLPNVSSFKKILLESPSDAHYANYMLHSLDYYFTKSYAQGIKLFQSLPFNHQAYLWALFEFHPVYKAAFVPTIPTLILGADCDFMTPWDLFAKPEYKLSNISHVTIKKAAHFPWVEQPEQVTQAFARWMSKANVQS